MGNSWKISKLFECSLVTPTQRKLPVPFRETASPSLTHRNDEDDEYHKDNGGSHIVFPSSPSSPSLLDVDQRFVLYSFFISFFASLCSPPVFFPIRREKAGRKEKGIEKGKGAGYTLEALQKLTASQAGSQPGGEGVEKLVRE